MVANSFALRAAFDSFRVGCLVLSVVAFSVFVFLRFFEYEPVDASDERLMIQTKNSSNALLMMTP